MMGMDVEATGYENILLRSVFLGVSLRQARRNIADIEEFTGLGNFLHLPMRTYSSGMMVRLAFAISTAVTPDILIMDEVIASGDAAFLDRAQARLDRLIGAASILVIATHSDDVLRRMCNRAALLQGGRLLRVGPIDEILELYRRPDGPACPAE
jgi:ABC-2 type transport system ATP-binding protein/lipopolysaccharide transport system ATP-binding protein